MTVSAIARWARWLSALKPSTAIDAHVLLVDDSATERHLMGQMLVKLNATVSYATDGQQAVDLLERQAFDLVLMNGVMPWLHGDQATLRVRRNEHKNGVRRTIIVGMSSAADFRERFLQAGADDFLPTPTTGACFEQMLARWVPRKPA